VTTFSLNRPASPSDGESDASLSIVPAVNRRHWDDVREVRKQVFHDEQRLIGMDLTDADDDRSLTLIAYMGDCPVGTGRLTPPYITRPAYISWVATLPGFRGRGIGSAITRRLVEASDDRRYGDIHLSAQLPAVSLYERFGFTPQGPSYAVRDIKHQTMKREAAERKAGAPG
jgi:predicted GNAT family N-acyltransferase